MILHKAVFIVPNLIIKERGINLQGNKCLIESWKPPLILDLRNPFNKRMKWENNQPPLEVGYSLQRAFSNLSSNLRNRIWQDPWISLILPIEATMKAQRELLSRIQEKWCRLKKQISFLSILTVKEDLDRSSVKELFPRLKGLQKQTYRWISTKWIETLRYIKILKWDSRLLLSRSSFQIRTKCFMMMMMTKN